jgi:hypothetical protein
MKPTLNSHEAVISAPPETPLDLISAEFDVNAGDIVVHFRDGKVARVSSSEFPELAKATAVDYQFLDGTRAGVTCLTDNVDFAVAACWWRRQAQ